jgi:hypothetical protein
VWTSLPDGSPPHPNFIKPFIIKTKTFLNRRVNYYNAKWKEFSGVALEEGVVMGWWSLVHPNDLEACRKQFAQAMKKCKGFEIECR